MTANVSATVKLKTHSLAKLLPNHCRCDRILGEDRAARVRFRLKTQDAPDARAPRIIEEPTHDLGDRVEVALGYRTVVRQFEWQAGSFSHVEGQLSEGFPHRMEIAFTR